MDLMLYPKEWLTVECSDYVLDAKSDIVDGPFGSNLKATEYQDKGVPIVRIQNVKRFNFIDKNIRYLTVEKSEELARHSFKAGDILITKLGEPLGLACEVPTSYEYGIIVADLVRMRPNISVCSTSFLIYLLNSEVVIKQIKAHVKGSTRARINLSVIRELKLPLPPLAEQKIIADKLDTLLAQVESIKARLERITEILKQFRQSVLAAAVSGKLTEEWEGYDWQDMTIGEIAKVRTGKTPSRTEEKYWENGVIPWLTSSVTGSEYCFKADEFISELASKECNLKPFPVGTLLLAMYGEGKTRGQVTELKLEATCNQACAAIIPNNEIALTSFVKLKLQENYEAIRLAASGGNQPNLNLNKVREISIQVPTLEVQIKIVQEVEKLLTISEEVNQQVRSALDRVNNLTQSILAKAFRGELTAEWREANPELISGENSAEALLERIKVERSAKAVTKRGRGKA